MRRERRWEKLLAQKENLDREVESQRLWNCAEKRAGAQLALLGKKPTDPQTGQAWRNGSLGAKTLGSLEECSSSFKFKRPLLNSYTGAVLGSGECLLKGEVKHAMPSRNSLA